MSNKNVMDDFAWSHHEERMAKLTGVIDVGVGLDAVRASGLLASELGILSPSVGAFPSRKSMTNCRPR
jgi:hypothetical protein